MRDAVNSLGQIRGGALMSGTDFATQIDATFREKGLLEIPPIVRFNFLNEPRLCRAHL